MIQLMKRKVGLRSLEEDMSVILTNHLQWNHFYTYLLISRVKLIAHVLSRKLQMGLLREYSFITIWI